MDEEATLLQTARAVGNHFRVVFSAGWSQFPAECQSCQTSCQSACKTSCTVSNQPCSLNQLGLDQPCPLDPLGPWQG